MGRIKLCPLLLLLSVLFAIPSSAKSLSLYTIKFETQFSLIKNALPINKKEQSELINKAISHHAKYLLFKLNEYDQRDKVNIVTPALSSFTYKQLTKEESSLKQPPIFPKLKYVQNVGTNVELAYVKKATKKNYKKERPLKTITIGYKASIDFYSDGNLKQLESLRAKMVVPKDPYFLYFYFPRSQWHLTKSKIRERTIPAPICTSANESLEFPEQNFWYYWSPYREYKNKSCINDLKSKELLSPLKITSLKAKANTSKEFSFNEVKDITIFLGTIKTNYKDISNNKIALQHIESFLKIKKFQEAKKYLTNNKATLNPTLINFLITTWSLERFYKIKSKNYFKNSNHIKLSYNTVLKSNSSKTRNITLFFGDTEKTGSPHKELLESKIDSDAIIYIGHAGHGETLPKNIMKNKKNRPRVLAFLSCFSRSYINLQEVSDTDTLITTGNSYRDIESKALFSLLQLFESKRPINENVKYLTKNIPVFIEKGLNSERI